MKKYILLLLVSFSLCAYGQIGLTKSAQNWRFGGNVGLNFGSNDLFAFNISPFLGYMIAPQLEGGATLGYQYSSQKHWRSNLFSVGPYLNYYPIANLFLRGHYEYFTGNHKYKVDGVEQFSQTIDENALWLGGGYVSGVGPVRFYAGLLYNVLYDNKKDEGRRIFDNGFRPYAGVSVGF